MPPATAAAGPPLRPRCEPIAAPDRRSRRWVCLARSACFHLGTLALIERCEVTLVADQRVCALCKQDQAGCIEILQLGSEPCLQSYAPVAHSAASVEPGTGRWLGEPARTHSLCLPAQRPRGLQPGSQGARLLHQGDQREASPTSELWPLLAAARGAQRPKCCREMLLMVTPDVPPCSHAPLRSVGWRLAPVQAVSNPGRWSPYGVQPPAKFPKQFAAVYTKLLLFNMTQYDRSGPRLCSGPQAPWQPHADPGCAACSRLPGHRHRCDAEH